MSPSAASFSFSAEKMKKLQPRLAQRHVPKKRAFCGLAGRNTAEDLSGLTVAQIIAMEQIPQSLVEEVRKTEERRLAGLPDPEAGAEEVGQRFQDYAFSKNSQLRKTYDSEFELVKIGNGDGTLNQITKVFGDDREGHSVQNIPGYRGFKFRRGTPWWLRNESAFNEFLRLLISEQVGFDRSGDLGKICGRELQKLAGLDCAILRDFYCFRAEDTKIFEQYETDFRSEHLEESSEQSRWTSSPEAVKMRRIRLIERGDDLFENDSRRPARRHYPMATIRRMKPLKSAAFMTFGRYGKSF
jgi:hypothetical protein